MRIVVWLFRALVFFALFAFALNNQHEATIHWFFGRDWRAPMAIVALIAFTFGCVFGVLAMVPSWWRQRKVARQHAGNAADDATLMPGAGPVPAPGAAADSAAPSHPPRDGL